LKQEGIEQAKADIMRYAELVAEGLGGGISGVPWLELCRAKARLDALRRPERKSLR
jgi:hypothetical protein